MSRCVAGRVESRLPSLSQWVPRARCRARSRVSWAAASISSLLAGKLVPFNGCHTSWLADLPAITSVRGRRGGSDLLQKSLPTPALMPSRSAEANPPPPPQRQIPYKNRGGYGMYGMFYWKEEPGHSHPQGRSVLLGREHLRFSEVLSLGSWSSSPPKPWRRVSQVAW